MDKIKSIFISDTHIGVRHNNVKKLIEVLDMYDFENLFLIGDIIDMTALRKRMFWKKQYGYFIKKLIKLSEKVNIVYITGNHDYYLREFTPFEFSLCKVVDEYIYGDMLLIHGDKFDTLINKRKYLYMFGDYGYNLVIRLDKMFNFQGCLSKRAKRIAKQASNYLNDFYKTAEKYTLSKDCKKIICGHVHIQEYREMNVEYYNCGDFRESSTYIIENLDGTLELRG